MATGLEPSSSLPPNPPPQKLKKLYSTERWLSKPQDYFMLHIRLNLPEE